MDIDVTASDIIDAIHQMYEDDPATEAAYMAWLRNMTDMDRIGLVVAAVYRLEEMGRCNHCGAQLEYHHGKEWHPETQDYEPYIEAYCPMCDISEEDM